MKGHNTVQGKSRRDGYTEATKNALKEAALELFTDRGYTQTSLDEIADRARVSKGAIYHHFANKREVFEATLMGIIPEYTERLREHAAVYPTDSWKAITALLNAYLDICVDPTFRRMMLQEGPIALGWERWRQVEREALLGDFFGLAELCTHGIKIEVSAEMLLMSLAGAVQEITLAVTSSPDPKRATVEARSLINELVSSVHEPRG
jgi:AcrR family transcriptional regulator